MARKRRAMEIEYYRYKRMSKWSGLYGVEPIDINGNYWDDEEDPDGFLCYKRLWRGKKSRILKKFCTREYRHAFRYKRNPDLSVSRSKGIKHRETEFWWALD